MFVKPRPKDISYRLWKISPPFFMPPFARFIHSHATWGVLTINGVRRRVVGISSVWGCLICSIMRVRRCRRIWQRLRDCRRCRCRGRGYHGEAPAHMMGRLENGLLVIAWWIGLELLWPPVEVLYWGQNLLWGLGIWVRATVIRCGGCGTMANRLLMMNRNGTMRLDWVVQD